MEFTLLYELKCTIHAILQHMGFYHTTENPCVMMRAKHNTKSCECIIHPCTSRNSSHCEGKIQHQNQFKCYEGSDFPYDPGGTMIC